MWGKVSQAEVSGRTEGMAQWGDLATPYQVVKSARQTMGISVDRMGRVSVRIPNDMSYADGHSLAKEKARWICSHVAEIQNQVKEHAKFQWADGALVEFHGERRKLRLVGPGGGKRAWVEDAGQELLIHGEPAPGERTKAVVIDWYKKKAREYLAGRTRWWAGRMGISYGRISIRDQASRWGSCSAKGNLNYNWKLVLLPEELSDYVVVHELAHRREMNHSENFWMLVKGQLPDYIQRRRMLKNYETQINSKY